MTKASLAVKVKGRMNAPTSRQNDLSKVRPLQAVPAASPIIRPDVAGSCNEEPSLDELFAEPIVVMLMARDGIDRRKLRVALEHISSHRADEAPNKRAIVSTSPGSRQPMWRGPLCLDRARHRCTWKGHNIDLTVKEFALLELLADRPDHVKTRDQLMDIAFGKEAAVYDRTIDSHIKRIRNKFKSVDKSFAQIQTVWGLGYRYVDAAKAGTREVDELPSSNVIAARTATANHRR